MIVCTSAPSAAVDLWSAAVNSPVNPAANPAVGSASADPVSASPVSVDTCAAAIAELEQLKQELQFREQQLHLALESAGITVFTWDISQERVDRLQNPYFPAAIEAHQTIHTLADKLNAIHPDDRDRYRVALDKAMYQTGQLAIEHRQILADGSIVWLIDKARVIYDTAGSLMQLIGVATDITERKQVEQTLQNREDKLKSFIDANEIGILFGDVYGNILDADDEFLRIVGYTREDLRSGELEQDYPAGVSAAGPAIH